MARTISLADLQTYAYRKTDVENAVARFPAAEVTTYLNDGIAEFVDLIIRNRGTMYYESQWIIVCTGNQTVYAMPPDFYQMIQCQANIANTGNTQGDINFQIRAFLMSERAALSSQSPGIYGVPTGYMLHGGTVAQAMTTQGTIPTQYAIEFLPKPSSNLQILIYYIPTTPKLVNQYDLFDGINGWEQYPAIWAAIQMRRKDDLPTDMLEADLAKMRERMEAMVPHRDRVGPGRVSDVRQDNFGWWGRRNRYRFGV